jgi:uncharacterized lipoprotein YmbA
MKSLIVFVVLLGVAACGVLDPRPDTSRYFLLRAVADPAAGAPLDDLVLGLGPVTLPDYLDRNEMLDVVGPYELKYSAKNRWVEPLGAQVRRTLADNLGTMLRPDAVLDHPWFTTDGVTLQVEVAFDAIRLDDAGAWVGSAEWVLRDPASGRALERSDFEIQLGRDAVPPDQVASGMSTELERLSADISAAVRRHAR